MSDAWSLYIIECRGGGLYVGIAKDPGARYLQHCRGRGALYTRLNPPVALLATYPCPDRRSAITLERWLKSRSYFEKRRWAAALGARGVGGLMELPPAIRIVDIDDGSGAG